MSMDSRQKEELKAMEAPGIPADDMEFQELLNDLGKNAATVDMKNSEFMAVLMHGKKLNLCCIEGEAGYTLVYGGKHFELIRCLTSETHKHPNGKAVTLNIYDERPPEVRFPDIGVKL